MEFTQTSIYQKAFNQYLRRGTPIDISIKALLAIKAEAALLHPTPQYIWRTQGDDKVRPSHAANEGQIFAWDNPPATGNPGDEYGCRCAAEPYYGIYDPPIEPLYPELALIPLLRVGRLLVAWRAWVAQRALSRAWKLGSHKSAIKWWNRLEKGDWTPEKITRTIKERKAYKAPNKVNKPNTATGYELDGNFVVVDDVTGEVLQVSGPGFVPEKLLY